jgi:hypothetical protein
MISKPAGTLKKLARLIKKRAREADLDSYDGSNGE